MNSLNFSMEQAGNSSLSNQTGLGNSSVANCTAADLGCTCDQAQCQVADDDDDTVLQVLVYLNKCVRVMAVLIYGLYFLAVFVCKNMQKKNFFYAHHSNFCSFLFCLLLVCFLGDERPSFEDEVINDVLCTVTEVAWGIIKSLQSYSIMLLALYRYLAVYHPASFKRLNKSNKTLMVPIALIWIISIVIFTSTKFGFQTTYGRVYCFDGYSKRGFSFELDYFIVFSVFSILIPLMVVMLAYYETYKKIKANDAELEHDYDNNSATMGKSSILAAHNAELNGQNPVNTVSTSATNGNLSGRNQSTRASQGDVGHNHNSHMNLHKFMHIFYVMQDALHLPHHHHDGHNHDHHHHHHHNEHHHHHDHHHHHHYGHHHKFLKQLKALDICYSFYFIFSILTNSRYVLLALVTNSNVSVLYYKYLLTVFLALNVFFLSSIPFITLYYNPSIAHKLSRIFASNRVGGHVNGFGHNATINQTH